MQNTTQLYSNNVAIYPETNYERDRAASRIDELEKDLDTMKKNASGGDGTITMDDSQTSDSTTWSSQKIMFELEKAHTSSVSQKDLLLFQGEQKTTGDIKLMDSIYTYDELIIFTHITATNVENGFITSLVINKHEYVTGYTSGFDKTYILNTSTASNDRRAVFGFVDETTIRICELSKGTTLISVYGIRFENALQENLDEMPIKDSTNPVQSGGVFSELEKKQTQLDALQRGFDSIDKYQKYINIEIDYCYCVLETAYSPVVGNSIPFVKQSGTFEVIDSCVVVKPKQIVEIAIMTSFSGGNSYANMSLEIKDVTNNVVIDIFNPANNANTYEFDKTNICVYENNTELDVRIGILVTRITNNDKFSTGTSMIIKEIGRKTVIEPTYFIEDGITSESTLWSSSKISQEINNARDTGGSDIYEIITCDIADITEGTSEFTVSNFSKTFAETYVNITNGKDVILKANYVAENYVYMLHPSAVNNASIAFSTASNDKALTITIRNDNSLSGEIVTAGGGGITTDATVIWVKCQAEGNGDSLNVTSTTHMFDELYQAISEHKVVIMRLYYNFNQYILSTVEREAGTIYFSGSSPAGKGMTRLNQFGINIYNDNSITGYFEQINLTGTIV